MRDQKELLASPKVVRLACIACRHWDSGSAERARLPIRT